MDYPKINEEERAKKLQLPNGRLRLVIDTDAKNEIDDQFAIAWALSSSERFDVEALYAAPFSHDCLRSLFTGQRNDHAAGINYAEKPEDGMLQSYDEILKLGSLMKIDIKDRVFKGSAAYISDMKKAVISEAAEDLVKRAMESEETLYIAALGAITNIASAIMLEPRIIEKIVVIWLGGQPLYFDHGIEFNLIQDKDAARIIFDSGVPLVLIPCMNVASLLSLSKDETKANLIGKGNICSYLGENVVGTFGSTQNAVMAAAMFNSSYLKGREDQNQAYLQSFKTDYVSWSRIIWDISAIAFLKNPSWTPSALAPSPILNDDFTWGKDERNRHKIRVVNYCHRDLIFGDMFASLQGK